MCQEVGLYLPPYKCCNIYWLKLIITMRKKALKNSEIKHCFAPQYESLSIKRLFEFCSLHPEVYEYFPEERDLPRLNR